jgi:hypothetical protein
MIACSRGQLEAVEVYGRASKTMMPGKALCLPTGFCVNSGTVSEEVTLEKNARSLLNTDPQDPQEAKKSKTS